MEDLHSPEGWRFQPGCCRSDANRMGRAGERVAGMRRIFSSLFFSLTLSSTLEASLGSPRSSWCPSASSLCHLPEDGAKPCRLRPSAATFTHSDGWKEEGVAGFLCAPDSIRRRRGRNAGPLLCTGSCVLLHKACFLFFGCFSFFYFAPHNIEVKQENHGTLQPSAKKVGTANGRVMISSSWLQLEEQLKLLDLA